MMHISSNFGEGWARWWMNCSRQQVRVKTDGPKHVKLKGIDIIVAKPGTSARPGTSAAATKEVRTPSTIGDLHRVNSRLSDEVVLAKSLGRKMPVKRVTGIRIEFKTEEERNKFIEMSRRAQERMIPLPDL